MPIQIVLIAVYVLLAGLFSKHLPVFAELNPVVRLGGSFIAGATFFLLGELLNDLPKAIQVVKNKGGV